MKTLKVNSWHADIRAHHLSLLLKQADSGDTYCTCHISQDLTTTNTKHDKNIIAIQIQHCVCYTEYAKLITKHENCIHSKLNDRLLCTLLISLTKTS